MNDKQIIKNFEKDSYTSPTWERTLKYIDKNNIPYEYLFSLISFNQKSLKGLPYYLILSGKIKDFDFIYNGLSIAVIFEMFRNQNKFDNFIIKNGGEFKVSSDDLDKQIIRNIIQSIKDIEILKPIILENKELLFDKFEAKLSHYSYDFNFSNFLHFSYMNNDIDIVNTILFDLGLSKSEKMDLIYNGRRRESFFSRLLVAGDINMLLKLDKEGLIDFSKVISFDSFVSLFFNGGNYPVSDKDVPNEDKFKVLDFVIEKDFDKALFAFSKKDFKFKNEFLEFSESLRNNIGKAKPFMEYYIENSDSLNKNYYFWSLVFIDNIKYVKPAYSHFTKEEKFSFFNFISKKKDVNFKVLDLFLSDDDFELNVKINESIPLNTFLRSSGYSSDKRTPEVNLKIAMAFLEAGSRTNNLNKNNSNLKGLLLPPMDKFDDKYIEEVNSLLEKYKDNYQEVISFVLKDLGRDPYSIITNILNQLKEILLKKAFYKVIDDIMFIKKDGSELYFLVNSDTIVIPEENISGNEFTEKSFKRI